MVEQGSARLRAWIRRRRCRRCGRWSRSPRGQRPARDYGRSWLSPLPALAALLAAVGIFSVLMFMVQQRAREFSVRLAVGASS